MLSTVCGVVRLGQVMNILSSKVSRFGLAVPQVALWCGLAVSSCFLGGCQDTDAGANGGGANGGGANSGGAAVASAANPSPASVEPGSNLPRAPFVHVLNFIVPGKSAEIVAATPDGKFVVYTDAPGRQVGFLNIEEIAAPKRLGLLPVGGEPTSVDVTSDGKYMLVCVTIGEGGQRSELLVISVEKRAVVRRMALPGQPDCLKVSPDGAYAAIAIENQRKSEAAKMPDSPPGALVVLDIEGPPTSWKSRLVNLTGLKVRFPQDPEPEYVTIDATNMAAVTLQENNGIVLVDLKAGRVVDSWSCGRADHLADTQSDKKVSFTDAFRGLREPDGVAWTPGGHLLTANEGDYELDVPAGLMSGGRGATLFDARGKVVWDSGNSIENLAHAAGAYKDKRSDKKGVEPESAAVARYLSPTNKKSITYGFVGCERADGVAVLDLSQEGSPQLVGWLATGERPEGLLPLPQRGLLLTANEGDGTLSIFRYAGQ